jgi:hypothetical protein
MFLSPANKKREGTGQPGGKEERERKRQRRKKGNGEREKL